MTELHGCVEKDMKLPTLSDPNDIDRIRRQFEEKSSNGNKYII
jgi:hypothetical protein